MLSSWLLEALLARWDEWEDQRESAVDSTPVPWFADQVDRVQTWVFQLLEAQADVLPRNTVYQLARQHARPEVLLRFAEEVHDARTRIGYFLEQDDWSHALRTLASQDDMELYYTSATHLLGLNPDATVTTWIREPRLDPRRLLPALLLYRPPTSAATEENHQAIRYLDSVVRAGNTDPAVHNTLLTLLASGPSEGLVLFVDQIAPRYDLAYALRTCLAHNQKEAAVHIYTLMGRPTDAVDLALTEPAHVEAACRAASRCTDPLTPKQLWLRIAQYVVHTASDMGATMGIVDRSGWLSIEDVLPFFPDFVRMDTFKSQVVSALHAYTEKIDQLSTALDEATTSAQRARDQTSELERSRFVTVIPTQACALCVERSLIDEGTQPFYTFICGHAFHGSCLVRAVAQRAPRTTRRTWAATHARLASLAQGVVPALPTPLTWPLPDESVAVLVQGLSLDGTANRLDGLRDMTPEDLDRIYRLRHEVEGIVAAACPVCAAAVVDVDAPLEGSEAEPWLGDW